MSTGMKFVVDVAFQAVLIVLFLGSLFAVAYGVSMYLRQRWVHALNDRTKHWVSSREALRPLERPRNVDSFLHRRHASIGLVMVLGSAFVVYVAFFRYEASALTSLFPARLALFAPILVQTCWWLAVLGAILGLVVGGTLTARPQLLRALEEWANRSYSERRALKPLEQMNFAVDQWTVSSPRLSGALIALGGLYAVLVLGYFLLLRL